MPLDVLKLVGGIVQRSLLKSVLAWAQDATTSTTLTALVSDLFLRD
jgi:hypothetical protein